MTSLRDGLVLDSQGEVVARWVFTARHGGSSPAPFDSLNLGSHVGDDPSAVRDNRMAVGRLLGIHEDRLTFMRPDHGRGVAVIGGHGVPVPGIDPERELRDVDALVTAEPRVGLVALAADCVPCLLVDPEARVVAAVHSGWRGVAVDVVGAALESMRNLGASPESTRAFLGPAICGQCYPVPPERAEEVGAIAPEAVGRAADGQPSLDLRRGLQARLVGMGVQVEMVGGCTAESEQLFSHRRDQLTGRQSGAIALLAGRSDAPGIGAGGVGASEVRASGIKDDAQ